jgi:hypothetical protein
MTRKVLVLCAAAVLLGGAGRLFAHHSFTAAYDNTKRVKIEGVVTEFIWRNPHSFLRIDVTNEAGESETWSLEWGSSSQLSAEQYPVTRTSIRPGDRIIAGGEPGRDPKVKRLRIYSIDRPIDGWKWEGTVR